MGRERLRRKFRNLDPTPAFRLMGGNWWSAGDSPLSPRGRGAGGEGAAARPLGAEAPSPEPSPTRGEGTRRPQSHHHLPPMSQILNAGRLRPGGDGGETPGKAEVRRATAGRSKTSIRPAAALIGYGLRRDLVRAAGADLGKTPRGFPNRSAAPARYYPAESSPTIRLRRRHEDTPMPASPAQVAA